jgi:hypothetical protein
MDCPGGAPPAGFFVRVGKNQGFGNVPELGWNSPARLGRMRAVLTNMGTIRAFFIDSFRLMAGRPLLGESVTGRSTAEIDARATVERYSRGNVAMQAGLFVSEVDSARERDEVAKH